jgi:glycosyltransferase involved in cell wall biosynthesis
MRGISGQMKKNARRLGFFMEQFGLGGTDVHLVNLINNWPDDADEIFYITNAGNKGLDLFRSLLKRKCEIKIIRLASYGYLSQLLGKPRRSRLADKFLHYVLFCLEYPLFLLDIVRLALLFRKYSFDVFISDNGGYPGSDSCRAAVFAALLCGVKQRYALIHHKAERAARLAAPFEFLIDRLLQRAVKGIITVSRASAASLLGERAFTGKISVIYNGIEDAAPPAPAVDLRKVYGIAADKKIIGLIGNVEPHKGHRTVIDAAPEILARDPRAHFVFIGSLYDENWDRSHADSVVNLIGTKDLEERITVTGFLKGHPLSYIAQFDVLLMPTVDFEGFGLVLAEAMILKKPIVASAVGAIPEVIVNGKSGLLVPPRDPAALRVAVVSLLADAAKARAMAESARKRYEEHFTAGMMSQKYYDLVGR